MIFEKLIALPPPIIKNSTFLLYVLDGIGLAIILGKHFIKI
jgi:hypothetical protein